MSMFSQRRPRGFNHRNIFVDERRDSLRLIEENARRQLGMSSAASDAGGEGDSQYASGEEMRRRVHAAFTSNMSHLRRRGERRGSGLLIMNVAVVLILVFVLISVCRMLLSA